MHKITSFLSIVATDFSFLPKTTRIPEMISYCMVWYGMVWYGMVWYGMVWYGMVWYGNTKRIYYLILYSSLLQ